METSSDKIREQQKQSWNKFSPGWKKWDQFNMAFLQPMGKAIIEQLNIQESDHVLDIATGTGEPGISIAALASKGQVTGTDIAENMLTTARENAQQKGLDNYQTQVADAGDLPFADGLFDAVSCRMGFMFFPDMQQAANEMYRVLKSGGRLATSVWYNPDQNDWVNTIMGVIKKHIELPPPTPGAPGMFRCAAPQLMHDILAKAGFTNINEQIISDKADYETFEQYWEMMLDVGAPIVAAMAGASDATVAAIKADTAALFQSKNPDGGAKLTFSALVISGQK